MAPNGYGPLFVTISPSPAEAGSQVQITVTLDGIPDYDLVVTIEGSGGIWSQLPDSVTVPEGQSAITFPATVSSQAAGKSGAVSASANGKRVNQPLLVTPMESR